jgi:dephospho-CoA kinase
VCVVGQIGSGKSEAVRTLKEQHGYSEINSGRVVARLLGIPPVPDTARPVFQSKAWDFIRGPEGPSMLASAILEEARRESSERVVIDGIRQLETLEALRELAKNRRVSVVFVHTPFDIAYQFYRERISTDVSLHDFVETRSAPVESEVSSMLKDADAVLYNWSGKRHYREAIRELLENLGAI